VNAPEKGRTAEGSDLWTADVLGSAGDLHREQRDDSGGYGYPDHSDDPNYQAIYGRKPNA
jgi:hypothetical protein